MNEKLNVICVPIWVFISSTDWLNGQCIKVKLFLFGIVLFSLYVIFGKTSPLFGFNFKNWTFLNDSDITWDLNGKRAWNELRWCNLRGNTIYISFCGERKEEKKERNSILTWLECELSTLHECQAHTISFASFLHSHCFLWHARLQNIYVNQIRVSRMLRVLKW